MIRLRYFGGSLIAVLPQPFDGGLDDLGIHIALGGLSLSQIWFSFWKISSERSRNTWLADRPASGKHSQHGYHQPVQEKVPVMTGYPSVIQAVDEFIHQLRRFLAVAVIDRFGERIFHNFIIIAAYNTVVPGDFLIKVISLWIPWPAPPVIL